jgi:hypothetical protein
MTVDVQIVATSVQILQLERENKKLPCGMLCRCSKSSIRWVRSLVLTVYPTRSEMCEIV